MGAVVGKTVVKVALEDGRGVGVRKVVEGKGPILELRWDAAMILWLRRRTGLLLLLLYQRCATRSRLLQRTIIMVLLLLLQMEVVLTLLLMLLLLHHPGDVLRLLVKADAEPDIEIVRNCCCHL